ncbi:M15 family metallopeptidase [Marinoscillum furvescens]|uniref:D-alanyl-D-alanine carboxypeptidase-like protein n=1 Tax=Marinoscillum furvescens DSM 4134 TaxID=1122208 RepID=A0A3D9L5Q8_MARFU|nr:M15 family metallopeptidase [Marinoscillum furvescens]REE01527.1 D-alanyl-D-alanine carboxypeptidase-like protein [Marinoscillum furvescens DSM 4134]
MERQLIDIVLILLPLSFISERMANIFKLLLPSRLFGNLRHKEESYQYEKRRELKVMLVSLLAGQLVAFGTGANLFEIFDGGTFGWRGFSWNAVWGCFFTGFFLSWGSKFWHDLLDILLEVKNTKKALNQTRQAEVKLKQTEIAREIEKGGLEHMMPEPATDTTPAKARPKEDPHTLKRLQKLHPDLREEALKIYQDVLDRHISIRVTDTLRTFEEQEALYAKGRTQPGRIVTHARAGESYHNYGLGVDFCLLLNGSRQVSWDRTLDLDGDQLHDWDEVVAVFKHYGWEWGGDWTRFKDYPHFQKTFGHSTAALRKLHDAGKLTDDHYVILPQS